MKFMAAEELKRRSSSVIDEVYRTGKKVTITKNGEPVAMLVACREEPAETFPFTSERKKKC